MYRPAMLPSDQMTSLLFMPEPALDVDGHHVVSPLTEAVLGELKSICVAAHG